MIPNISFGIIVLNGEPFTRYNLRALYPWAHQIIVVEGACRAATEIATTEGHSSDGTVEVLWRFKQEEDPQNKIIIVRAEDEGHPNGFWPGEKHEMSQAYAKRATGDYLWQVDIDEFYLEQDFYRILSVLKEGYTQINFPTLSFWGGMDYIEDGKYFRLNKADEFRRLFRWGVGYTYKTHRPPTVLDQGGHDVAQIQPLDVRTLRRSNIYMYHYSMLLPKQVLEKCQYYSKVSWAAFDSMNEWVKKTYFELAWPYHVQNSQHCTLAWLERWHGEHPSQVLEMMAAIQQARHPGITLRDTADIECLMKSKKYGFGRNLLKIYIRWLSFYAPLRTVFMGGLSKIAPRWVKSIYHVVRPINP